MYKNINRMVLLSVICVISFSTYADSSLFGSAQTRSVKDFGATGDGRTDDTLALQSALDWLSKSGARLEFAKGEYKVTAPLTLPVNKSAEIEGNNATINAINLSTNQCNNAIKQNNVINPNTSVVKTKADIIKSVRQ